jgi:hypothetical protein
MLEATIYWHQEKEIWSIRSVLLDTKGQLKLSPVPWAFITIEHPRVTKKLSPVNVDKQKNIISYHNNDNGNNNNNNNNTLSVAHEIV